jgi:hypothetical protein
MANGVGQVFERLAGENVIEMPMSRQNPFDRPPGVLRGLMEQRRVVHGVDQYPSRFRIANQVGIRRYNAEREGLY